MLDSFLLGAVGFVSGLALFDFYARLGRWGRLIGFAVAFPYFSVLNSAIGNGGTVGKRIMGIDLVDARGSHISLARSCVRYLILGLPFFLNGAPIDLSGSAAFLGVVLALIVFGVGGSTVYLFIFNRRTRQSMHDLAVGSYVTRVGGTGGPSVKPIWPGHLAIVGAWCFAILGLSAVAPTIAKTGPFPELLAVQKMLQASENVRSVSVFTNTNWNYRNGAKSKVSSLQVSAITKVRPQDYEAEAEAIASKVLAAYPGVSEDDALMVTVVYGFDIGIAQTWTRRTFQHSPREWSSIVRAVR